MTNNSYRRDESAHLRMGDSMTTACLTFDFDAFSIWFSTFKQTTLTPLSRGEYSGRVGISRVLDLLHAKQVQATFFVPAHSAASFPDAIRRMVAEGHEVASHGLLHETPVGLTLEAEEEALLRSKDILERISGETISGYRSPAWDLTDNTISLLEKHGYRYDSSLMADDFRPYHVRRDDRIDETGFVPGVAGRILEFPVAWELDDYPYFQFMAKPINQGLRAPGEVFEIWRGEFDYCHANIDDGLFNLTCHPEIIGRGPRIQMLGRLIDHIRASGARFARLEDEAARRGLSPVPA